MLRWYVIHGFGLVSLPFLNLLQTFKENPDYRLESPPTAEEMRNKMSRAAFGRLTPLDQNATPLKGRNSIFVGNLPSTISQIDLKAIFGSFGTIRNVEIVSRVNMFNRRSPQLYV